MRKTIKSNKDIPSDIAIACSILIVKKSLIIGSANNTMRPTRNLNIISNKLELTLFLLNSPQ